jgi:hypothetical protein
MEDFSSIQGSGILQGYKVPSMEGAFAMVMVSYIKMLCDKNIYIYIYIGEHSCAE